VCGDSRNMHEWDERLAPSRQTEKQKNKNIGEAHKTENVVDETCQAVDCDIREYWLHKLCEHISSALYKV